MCFISIEEYVLTALEIDNLSYLWRGEMVSWKLAWGKGKHSITFSCIHFHLFDFYNVSAVKKKNQKELVNKYFPGDSVIKKSTYQAGGVVWSPGREDPLEEEMANHSSILAWEIPWTEEPGGLQSMGLERVGHDIVTKQQNK